MAEYGEWNLQGRSPERCDGPKKYGVTRDFIVKGIQAVSSDLILP